MAQRNKLFSYLTDQINQAPEARYYYYNLAPELEKFNRIDTVNMSNEEMNKFRHVAGSKQAINDMGLYGGIKTMIGKEVKDLITPGNSKKDMLEDLKNDARAIKLHFKHPTLDGDGLYNYVFKNHIEPYRK